MKGSVPKPSEPVAAGYEQPPLVWYVTESPRHIVRAICFASVQPPPPRLSAASSADNAAKRAQAERGGEGPLLPKDLHDARERLTNDGRGPPLRSASPREEGIVGRGRGAMGGSLLGGGAVLVKGNAI